MKKNQLKSKLNSQNGITGEDVIISLVMILATVGVVAMLYTNLTVNSKSVDRKTGATRIATNIIENMSQLTYDELETALQANGASDASGNIQIGKIYGTTIPTGYSVNITFQNVYGTSEIQVDLLKKAVVSVSYPVSGITQSVSLNRVFEREVIRECNSPNFSSEYIDSLSAETLKKFSGAESDFNSTELIVCPLQYDKTTEKYKILENTNGLWYSYSNKQWARMILIPSEDLEDATEKIRNTYYLSDTSFLTMADNSYVWIPRFGIISGQNVFGGTTFQYRMTNNAIIANTVSNFTYNTLYIPDNPNSYWSSSYNSIAFGNTLGKWCKISDLTNNTTVAYYLNQSQYGPIVEY